MNAEGNHLLLANKTMGTRYTYKVFTMDDANDIIFNSQSEIDWWKILNWKSFIKLWADYIPTNCIKRVSEINYDNKELRKTLPQNEKDKVKAIMYKVDLSINYNQNENNASTQPALQNWI